MKILYTIYLLLGISIQSTLGFSQVSATTLLAQEGTGFGRDFRSRLERTKEVLALAERFAAERNILTARVTLQTKDGSSYPALAFQTEGTSPQNKEAWRISETMANLPLIFSPYDLSFSSNAFFDPNGSKLGVPYRFFTEGAQAASYLHELYHASTYQKVLSNQNPLWAGVMKTVAGTFISAANFNYYFRFASLDELSSTALSVKLNIAQLLELHRTQGPREFTQIRGAADTTLNEIYGSILAGKYLARQVADVAKRSLLKVDAAQTQSTKLALGDKSEFVNETTFHLESYSRESVLNTAYANGTVFSLYSTVPEDRDSLVSRLNQIRARALAAEAHFSNLESKIYVNIEYPRLEGTDLSGLAQLATRPFDTLEN